MTGGRLVVLGRVGRNFAAGMSGGIAYVFDGPREKLPSEDAFHPFEFYLNKGMVELSGLDADEDEAFVKEQIGKHIYWTGSPYAKAILDAWDENRSRFIKIMPVDYKRALQEMKLAEIDRKLYEIRAKQDLEQGA
jgi:glutamate synthase (NADPH/NADH) large chain